jgi:Flp pilus assembly protein TadD
MTYGTHRLNRSLWGEAEQSEAVPGVSVRDAFIAIRLGCIEEADAILRRLSGPEARTAAWFNLMGVVFEAGGDWAQARRYYGKAMRADRRFAPAEQNMRRWYELFTFGCTRWPVALGDETNALCD